MDEHEQHMRRALDLAERGWGKVSPNPLVGALLVAPDGDVVGEGWYEGPRGAPHAEVRALAAAGSKARGATLYCSLEPCVHQGSTPPCTDALIEAGVARVVVAAIDMNPVVDGRGLARLREAGIEVEAGLLADEAHHLNDAFERHVTTGLPFVVMKVATSLDGKTAAADGSSKWISSEASRADAHGLRAWADAIVVGSRTVLADDPSLTVRDPRWSDARPAIRVIVDSAGRVPAAGNVFDDSAPTLVATTDRAPEIRIREWQETGADVVVVDRDVAGGVSLGDLLGHLGKRDVQGVLVEGGATLAWSFARDQLLDRVVAYLAPTVLGGAAAPGMVMGAGFTPVGSGLRCTFERIQRIGPDLKVEARVHRDR